MISSESLQWWMHLGMEGYAGCPYRASTTLSPTRDATARYQTSIRFSNMSSSSKRNHIPPVNPVPPRTTPRVSARNEESDLDHGALVEFALRATVALHKECDDLAGQRKAQPLSGQLSTDLLDVKERLTKNDSLSAQRIADLLLDLERLVAKARFQPDYHHSAHFH